MLFFSSMSKSQVTVEAFPMNPQTGQHNYFGVRVTLDQTYDHDVTVTGYIHDDGAANTNNPFSLTVTVGNLTEETSASFYETDPTATAAIDLRTIVRAYGGVVVTYEVSNSILKFNSAADANAVLDQLEADYNSHNNSYESNLDTSLTTSQWDSLDVVNGFDSYKTFRDFENLFPGYSSRRSLVESTENAWLYNNYGGTNPFTIDFTIDHAENTIFNSDYLFKIGNDVYYLTSSGLYINDILQDDNESISRNNKVTSGIMYAGGINVSENYANVYEMSDCKTNKSLDDEFQPPGTNRKFFLKVAINSIGIRSSIKGALDHFEIKNGKPKRTRAKMIVGVGGYVYTINCQSLGYKSDVNGYKRRSDLKAVWRDAGIKKTKSGETSMDFAAAGGYSGTLILTW